MALLLYADSDSSSAV